MKYKILYPLLLLAGCFMMPACTEDENSGNDTPPAGALPSEEFVLNTLPDEPYAEDAILIENYEYKTNDPFYSLELMGDGYYLLLTKDPISTSSYASEAGQAKGKGALSKNRKAIRTRGTRDENGTIETLDGFVYGRFTKLADKKYRLSDGSEIDLQSASGSNKTATYKEQDGHISTVYVNLSKPTVTDATKSICHTWECNDFEYWLYSNGLYIAHFKQVFSNGRVDSYYKAVSGGPTKDEFIDSFADRDDECCYKVVFTSTDGNGGTYLCFYLDNEVDVCRWEWIDEKQGTLYWYDPYHPEDGVDEGHNTVRFAGNQMRIYGDGSEFDEGGNNVRLVGVNTLTAIK